MAYDIFVSYSTQDKLFVDALVHRLEESGYRVWYAPRDISAGVSWPAAITEAIRSIPVMLLVFSASSNSSDEISRELTLAGSNKCAVIPVRIENVAPSAELAYYLSNRHWLDVYDLESEKAIDCVLEGLERFSQLFPGRACAGQEAAPAAPKPRLNIQEEAQEDTPKVKHVELAAFLTAIVLILGAWGVHWLMSSPDDGIDPQAQVLKIGKNALMHSYSEREGTPVSVQIVRLGPLPDQDGYDEYLFVMSGIGGKLDGKVMRCDMAIGGEQMRYSAKINGKRQLVFLLDHLGRGQIFVPGEQKSFQVFLDYRATDAASSEGMLAAYREGRPWHPPRPKAE